MRIAVAGGTGWIGSLVVREVRERGHAPVVLARSQGVDLLTGKGLGDALRGVSRVIDVSNIATLSLKRAAAFFETATPNLLEAGQRAGVEHHVTLSIVGCDRVPTGYYIAKHRQEQLVHDSPAPTTVLRATQFHEFAAQMLARTDAGPVKMVPRMRTQPIAAAEVAAALVALALGDARGSTPELAGPEVREMTDMVKQLREATGQRALVVPLRLPGAAGKAMAEGALLPTEDGPRGAITFDAWVAERAAAEAGTSSAA
ncbi:SDR family oxidoreductase [Streptomyces justiciae]|uniref:SDR family oxidoreductase n=1 Tax=Streptomyces justiciae TaxID=2780140 RepID=UPI00188217F6|nr:NAD(P)H-binding protein [Streptomyces justiciae]MBE8475637.1 NAD(P)H-binding protein [Streptomyces justiciae]MCW8382562.1 NAD(P)H-binding protein [Streptomyces justiciae]